jgi:hypothetical protein
MELLKLPFNQNPIMINHKPNGDFNNQSFLDGLLFFFFIDKKGEGNYKGGSFPLLIRMEERMREPKGMLPKTRGVAAHLANACAR